MASLTGAPSSELASSLAESSATSVPPAVDELLQRLGALGANAPDVFGRHRAGGVAGHDALGVLIGQHDRVEARRAGRRA